MNGHEPELDDHYAGAIDWRFAWGLVLVALLVFLVGLGAGTLLGDSRGYARGYQTGLVDHQAADASGAGDQALKLEGCRAELRACRGTIERQLEGERVWAKDVEDGCKEDLAWSFERGREAGWETGYATARGDWERPCLGE